MSHPFCWYTHCGTIYSLIYFRNAFYQRYQSSSCWMAWWYSCMAFPRRLFCYLTKIMASRHLVLDVYLNLKLADGLGVRSAHNYWWASRSDVKNSSSVQPCSKKTWRLSVPARSCQNLEGWAFQHEVAKLYFSERLVYRYSISRLRQVQPTDP